MEELLHVVQPKVGEHYLVTPGMVHAAQDVRLLEIAESSELWFRLHAWGDGESELHLEEAFDLIDFKAYRMPRPGVGNPDAVMEKLAVTPQFTVNEIRLRDRVRVTDQGGSFRLYACVRGAGSVEVEGQDRLSFQGGDTVLVPAELKDFLLVPAHRDTLLLEVLLEPRHEPDAYIDPSAEPFLKGEDYSGLEGDELPDPELD